ncbi:MAG TPA: hypothetical protein DEH78_13615 [Solibacterales bacterium]|nr:hypothetical protein [Bryobacterales bacterium]
MPDDLTLEQARKRIDALLDENKRLAEELEQTKAQLAAVEKGGAQAAAERDRALKAAGDLDAAAKEAKEKLAESTRNNRVLTAQVDRLTKQVGNTPLSPLAPEEASILFDDVLKPFQRFTGFEVAEANLTLKLASAKLGDKAVIVVPQPGSVDPATLHELKVGLRGTRPAGLSPAGPLTSPAPAIQPVRPSPVPSRPIGAKAAKKRK